MSEKSLHCVRALSLKKKWYPVMGSGTYYCCPTTILERRQELSTTDCWIHNQVTKDNTGTRSHGSESQVQCPAWGLMPIVSAPRGPSQEYCHEFKILLRYLVTSKLIGVTRILILYIGGKASSEWMSIINMSMAMIRVPMPQTHETGKAFPSLFLQEKKKTKTKHSSGQHTDVDPVML